MNSRSGLEYVSVMMPNFHSRKKKRTEHFLKYIYKWKMKPCSACSGSGYYDHDGSPKCGACDGTGSVKEDPKGENSG